MAEEEKPAADGQEEQKKQGSEDREKEGEEQETVKKLLEEKNLLEKKLKSLSKIVELSLGKKETVSEDKAVKEIIRQLDEMRRGIRRMGARIEKAEKSDASERISQEIKTLAKTIEEKTRLLEKIPEIEKKIEILEKEKPKPKTERIFGTLSSLQSPPEDRLEERLIEIEKSLNSIRNHEPDNTQMLYSELREITNEIKTMSDITESLNRKMERSIDKIKMLAHDFRRLEERVNTIEKELINLARK